MRILVFPHAMELGGSQLNAIELAAAVRDRGHEVAVVSTAGVLVDKVSELGLEHIHLDPRVRSRPSWRAANQIRDLVERRSFEIVHGYEWPPALEAAASTFSRPARPVCTIMSMSVAPFLPRSLPITLGTQSLAGMARESGFRRVSVIEPPVDTRQNSLQTVSPLRREAVNVCESALLLVVVGRLVPELKLEGLLAACDATGRLTAEGVHAHLLIVGDGSARASVAAAAEAASALAGHRVVHLVGEQQDPRPAYASADIMLGMGGSAIRGMSFSKPLIVQGERGFWETLTPVSAPTFLKSGWYGQGRTDEGGPKGSQRLAQLVRQLKSSDRRAYLGSFGRQLVETHFSLRRAATVQEQVYQEALSSAEVPAASELVTSLLRAGIHQQARRVRSLWASVPTDDFNAVRPG